MKRHAALQPFSRDHNVGLVIARRLIERPSQTTLDELIAIWHDEMEDHFAEEERLLVPLATVEQAARLASEHRQLERLILKGEEEFLTAPEMKCLGELLTEHIRWEERVLFPALECGGDVDTIATETAALAKATEDRIEALTVREALDTDWHESFTKLGMLQVEQSFFPVSATVETSPPIVGDFAQDTLVRVGEDGETGTFVELCQGIFEHYKPHIGDEMGKLLADGKRTVEEISTTIGVAEFRHDFESPVYLMHEGRPHLMRSVTIRMRSTFSHQQMPVQHQALGDLRISTTEITDAESGTVFTVRAIQEKGVPGQAKMRIEPKQKTKTK